MAKTAKKRGKSRRVTELFAGWGFWLLLFVLLYMPCWYWVTQNAFNDMSTGRFPLAMAFILAVTGAGIIYFCVNSALLLWFRLTDRVTRKKG